MIYIVDENQKVKIKWFTRNKQKYVDLGYNYTKLGDEFEIPLRHLDTDSNRRVVVRCDDCGKEIITPYRNYNRIVDKNGAYRCRQCNVKYVSEIRINNNKEKEIQDFYDMVRQINCTPIATVDDYHGYNSPMPLICEKHGIQYLSINQLHQGCICPKCGATKKGQHNAYSIEDVINIVESKNGDKLLNPEDYINSHTKNMLVKCGSCGKAFTTSISCFMNTDGHCIDCGLKISGEAGKLTYDEIIERSTIDDVCYIINPQDYINTNTRNLLFRCVSCGNIIKKSLTHFSSGENRCVKCTSELSQGEYTISGLLDKYNIEYIQQKRFKDCRDKKPLPFDFYIPSYNCCIEFDGFQHHNMLPYDTEEKYEKRKIHDQMKTEYCKNNNIKLIRIPYWEYKNIDEILKKELCIM